MDSELVYVNDLAIYRHIVITRDERLPFVIVGRERDVRVLSPSLSKNISCFAWEYPSGVVNTVIRLLGETRRGIPIQDFNPGIRNRGQYRAFPDIGESDCNCPINRHNFEVYSRVNPRALVGFKITPKINPLLVGGPSIPASEACIDYDENQRHNLYNISLIVSGALLFLSGVVLLLRVWWKLSFNHTVNFNTAGYVALVMLCAVLMWLGMGLAATGFGML